MNSPRPTLKPVRGCQSLLSIFFVVLVVNCGQDAGQPRPPGTDGDSEAAVTAGPYVQEPSQDGVVIRWETDVRTSSVVYWGEGDNPNNWVQGEILVEDYSEAMLVKPRPGYRHKAFIGGLEPGKIYHYVVEKSSKTPRKGTFATAPLRDESFKMVVFGDTRTNHNDHRAVAEAIESEEPDLVVHVGDLVENATKDDLWDTFFEIEGPLMRDIPLYPIFGNHELMMEGVIKYKTMFGPFKSSGKTRYYSFDYGPLHGIVLDTEDSPYENTEQRAWLEQDLDEVAKRDYKPVIMVFFHRPLFTFGGIREPKRKLRAELEPLFKDHEIAAVIWGHNHCYERFDYNGIPHITTGGGGAPLTGLRQPEGDDAQYWKSGQSTYHYIRMDVTPGGFSAEVVRIPDLAVIDTFSNQT